ncbi:MAG: LapA family protein [Gammaproteobacteria bacterium]|nr:LapA family protein [Gammaproteobacteria bacterium]
MNTLQKIAKLVVYLVVLFVVVLGISFAYLNAINVPFNYYLGTVTLPLSILLLFALGLGILFGFLSMLPLWFRWYFSERKLKKLTNSHE